MPKSSIGEVARRAPSGPRACSIAASESSISAVSVISSVSAGGVQLRRRRARRDLLDQAGLAELGAGDVHADLQPGVAGVRRSPQRAPGGRPSGGPSGPSSPIRPRLLGQRDEALRQRRARASGCCQRTSASTPVTEPVAQAEDRLVGEHSSSRSTRPLQVDLELQALDDRRVHLGLEDRVAALAAALGPVHRQVGVAQQRLGIGPGPAAMPMLARDEDLAAAQLERGLERVEEPLRHARRVARAARSSSSRTANSSPPRRATVSPGRRHSASRSATSDQQPVAGRWPRLSLTVLKPSRSQKRTATGRPTALGAGERMAQPVEEAARGSAGRSASRGAPRGAPPRRRARG